MLSVGNICVIDLIFMMQCVIMLNAVVVNVVAPLKMARISFHSSFQKTENILKTMTN